MTDLQILVKQTSNPSILKMQQRLHTEVVELGKKALQWREGCEALQLALETEREAANLYAKQVAHWIEKHDRLNALNQELLDALQKIAKPDPLNSDYKVASAREALREIARVALRNRSKNEDRN